MTRQEQIDEAAQSEHIYEPKYGGKDHSGYDTMMKYEINYEREEAFCNGVKWADNNPDHKRWVPLNILDFTKMEQHLKDKELLIEALKSIADKKTDTSGAHSMRSEQTALEVLKKIGEINE